MQLPKASKLYLLSLQEQQALDNWLKKEFRKDYITKSKSPITTPVFFVQKKDGGLRLVQDYRKLNEITKKNCYPIPRINDLINSLSQAIYFTKLDLRWGYNNVRICKGDKWKIAFITHRGLYEAKVMYFGFCNISATFQAMINDILEDLILEGHILIYLDDILIYTNTIEEN